MDKQTAHVKRPLNMFMLWAKEERQKMYEGTQSVNLRKINSVLGRKWKTVSADVKQEWKLKADKDRANHKLQHPDYIYKPRRNPKGKPKKGRRKRKIKTVEYVELIIHTDDPLALAAPPAPPAYPAPPAPPAYPTPAAPPAYPASPARLAPPASLTPPTYPATSATPSPPSSPVSLAPPEPPLLSPLHNISLEIEDIEDIEDIKDMELFQLDLSLDGTIDIDDLDITIDNQETQDMEELPQPELSLDTPIDIDT